MLILHSYFLINLLFSFQNLLNAENDLSPDEIEVLRLYRSQRHKRQSDSKFYEASGIKQSIECGRNKYSTATRAKRQVNSDKIPKGKYEWPWIAALLDLETQSQFCGGSLINHNYVLTAAHCFWNADNEPIHPKDIIVRLGEWDLTDDTDTVSQDFFIADQKVHIHEAYEPSTQRNDIALIKLERSVDYNTFIRPICLPSKESKDNESTFVAGWGLTEDGGDKSFVLLEVELPVIKHERCIKMTALSTNIFEDSNLCAGGERGKDTCQGDSGGPLIAQEDNKRWSLRGIVSWGHGCGDYPGIYTNVRYYLDWIKKRIYDGVP